MAHNINVSHLFSKAMILSINNIQELLKQYNGILDSLLKKSIYALEIIRSVTEWNIFLSNQWVEKLKNNSNKSFD